MRAVRLFLRAQVVINFLMQAASTLEITNGEQRALHKFSSQLESLFIKIKCCFVPRSVADPFITGQQTQS